MTPLPDPQDVHPVRLDDGTPLTGTVQLGALDLPDNLRIGPYTYASTFSALDQPTDILTALLPYHFPFSAGLVEIGPFCQIADGARIITAGANHETKGVSSFPFPIFDAEARVGYQPDTRDTRIGADVWIGTRAMILPGAQIGPGTIIGAGAVVGGTVPPYSLVTGNRATIRPRFTPDETTALVDLAWWNWPAARIATHWKTISEGTPAELLALGD
ncbi:CatB-related O-acetyltransferase [Gymnodinialimonas hymeniacidonis]|uniref:CatB-related O-acetyltransferase n=1 Tax=Gymnodinialimonas hymeniacidonis TaxID=3126508 RepID=UPI0034C5BB65